MAGIDQLSLLNDVFLKKYRSDYRGAQIGRKNRVLCIFQMDSIGFRNGKNYLMFILGHAIIYCRQFSEFLGTTVFKKIKTPTMAAFKGVLHIFRNMKKYP